MNYHVTQDAPGRLARIGRHIAAIVAELNYASTRVSSAQNTPEHF